MHKISYLLATMSLFFSACSENFRPYKINEFGIRVYVSNVTPINGLKIILQSSPNKPAIFQLSVEKVGKNLTWQYSEANYLKALWKKVAIEECKGKELKIFYGPNLASVDKEHCGEPGLPCGISSIIGDLSCF